MSENSQKKKHAIERDRITTGTLDKTCRMVTPNFTKISDG